MVAIAAVAVAMTAAVMVGAVSGVGMKEVGI